MINPQVRVVITRQQLIWSSMMTGLYVSSVGVNSMIKQQRDIYLIVNRNIKKH
jgi:hypothetical protein